MNSDRKAGLITVAVAAVMIILSLQLDAGLATGAVGVSGTPIMIAGLALFFGLILIFFPDGGFKTEWPPSMTFISIGLLLVILLAYGYMLEIVGFTLASVAFMYFLLRLFTCTKRVSALVAVSSTLTLYIIFDYLLNISLPIGDLIRPWIS